MSKPEIIEKRPVAIPLVRETLKRLKKRDEELNFRAQRTEEYVNEVAKLKGKEAKDLVDKLLALEVPRVKPEHVHKIVDLMPINEKELKVVLQGYTLTISGENQKKIVELVNEYRGK